MRSGRQISKTEAAAEAKREAEEAAAEARKNAEEAEALAQKK
jgi:hypothetical protein